MDTIKHLINDCINEEKYIYSLEQLYALLEKNSVSIEERRKILIQVYEYNQKIYEKEKNKSKKLSLMSSVNEIKEEKVEQPVKTIKNNKSVEPLQCDCDLYLEKLKNVANKDVIISILPKRDNPDFDNIIDTILVSLYSQRIEIVNFIRLNQQEVPDIEDSFSDDLLLIDFQMETIIDYKDYIEDVVIEDVTTQNEIAFLKNSSLEPVIFQNIKGKEEYYESFLELLKSIEDGSFKNIRQFVDKDTMKDMYEVRGNKTRILFSRLKDNVFVVMAAFIKKCDTDLRHRNFVMNISQKYQAQKSTLLDVIENGQLNLEQQYLEQLHNTLSGKKKVKI